MEREAGGGERGRPRGEKHVRTLDPVHNAAAIPPLDEAAVAPSSNAPPAHGDVKGQQSAQPRKRPPRVRKRSAQLGASSSSTAEQLTWQQNMLLNVDAPAFQPDFDRRPTSLPQEQPASGPSDSGQQEQQQQQQQRKKRQSKRRPARVSDEKRASDSPRDGASGAAQSGGAPLCLLCCSPMQTVAFGLCDHRAACAACCLRLRMCYSNTDCPLCKADLQVVVIAPWRPDLPDFAFFLGNPELVARSSPGQLGPGESLVDRWQPGGRPPSTHLLRQLVGSTALACAVCDRAGRQPFRRRSQLEGHVRERHGRWACGLCLQEGRNFPLEQPLYDSEAALRGHGEAAHPRCSFCRGRSFYDSDALWAHMADAHFRCQLCEPSGGGDYAYFADAHALRGHLQSGHFACEEPDCVDCLVAFRTADELRRHCLQQHSARMPRWNPNSARPLQLDIQFVRRPAVDGGEELRRRRRRGGGGRTQDVRFTGGGGGGGGRSSEQPPARQHRDFAVEYDGGYVLIDDDLGMLRDGEAFPRMSGGPAAGAAGAGRHGEPQDEFPSLAAAAAAASAADILGSMTLNGGGREGTARLRPLPLVKRTVKCPCGRRVSHVVVAEGEEPPALPCDAVCQLEGRRARLADAFGVDPQHHVSSFQRRTAVWSGALLAAARRQPSWVQGLERELAAFIADAQAKRHALAPMPRAQRALVHALAEQYGLATAAQGQEPRRYVEVFKPTSAGGALPTRLLSRVAPTVTEEEVAALLREAEGHPIRIADVAPTADLAYYLRRWEGRFQVEWEKGSEAAVVRFESEADKAELLDAFGGGIRGLFRIDRGWAPRTAVPGGGTGTTAAAVAAPWAPHAGDGTASGSWTVVATAPPPPQAAPRRVQQTEQEEKASLPSGWVTIGKRAASMPRAQESRGDSRGGSPSSMSSAEEE